MYSMLAANYTTALRFLFLGIIWHHALPPYLIMKILLDQSNTIYRLNV